MKALAFALLLAGGAYRYALPDAADPSLPAGPGADLAEAHCTACHSFDYVTTQPRGKGAKFWADEVRKMVEKYGAPVPPADAEAISRYLARHYG